ncbi:MAG: Integrase catalytic region [Aeromicrobium sp.]|nr:Integrase catalytic region [Aeromicrobium sp.]
MHHIGLGRTLARTHVLILTQDLHVRVANAITGELTIDPARNYQPTGAPKGPTRK